MNVEKILKEKLSIVVTTYNRALYIEATLNTLVNSPLSKCSITVLNNSSTDNTLDVISKFKEVFSDFKIVTHPFNIGGNANIIRSLEYANKEYIWICHDDDTFDFSDVEDFAIALDKEEVDLIQIGAHVDGQWANYGGILANTKDLISQGYQFFFYSTFTPCNVFRKTAFLPYIIAGYNNIINSYTIMPFLLSFYSENKKIYLTKHQMVKAQVGNQGYDGNSLVKWLYNTSLLLPNKKDCRLCFFNMFGGNRFQLASTALIRNGVKGPFLYFWKMYSFIDCIVFVIFFLIYIMRKLIQKLFLVSKKTSSIIDTKYRPLLL